MTTFSLHKREFDFGNCLRTELKIPSGQRYELCRGAHAEENTIINAARTGTGIVNGEMYISNEKMKAAVANNGKPAASEKEKKKQKAKAS